MKFLKQPVAFIATAESTKSRYFYESILEFHCVSEDAFAIVFDLGVSSLRIQKVPSVPETNYTVLGWEVTNIQQSVAELSNKGVEFEIFSQLPQDELGIWLSPSGASIAWFKDPDGNTLSLTEVYISKDATRVNVPGML